MIIGVDEVGRGPLAGPVVAAAVVLADDFVISGLADSKKISAKKRQALSAIIFDKSPGVSIAEASEAEIDNINILQASLLAMRRAVDKLIQDLSAANLINNKYKNQDIKILVDGSFVFPCEYDIQAIVKGDSKIAEISAASIVAKVYRDNLMLKLAKDYPGYGFDKHMGYPTKLHLEALKLHGPCKIHRTSFAPVKAQLGQSCYDIVN